MRNKTVVSERGTVTIPGPVRKAAHIQPGDLIEFQTRGRYKIILRRLVVRRPEEEGFISSGDWEKFDKLVREQLKKGQYTGYSDLEKAKQHSAGLMGKKQ